MIQPLSRGHAQDVERLVEAEDEHAGERAADPLGPGGQHGVPHRREDRAARRVAAHEGEQVERNVLEVVPQVLGRADDLGGLDVHRVVGVGVDRRDPVRVDRGPQLGQAVPVEGAEAGLDVGVVDQEEPPVLHVAAARGPDGGVEDARLHLGRDRVGLHPAHGARRVQRFVDVHGPGLAAPRRR
jgi:hypothetical protein